MRERLNEILALHSGQPLSRIQDDTDRDPTMGASQAKEYGIIDDLLTKRARAPGHSPLSPRPSATDNEHTREGAMTT
jgi:ATP-dependent protease ClpP protease subunit